MDLSAPRAGHAAVAWAEQHRVAREGRTTSDPYAFLDPGTGGPERDPRPLVSDAHGAVVLLRGLRKRCPRCGERGIFLSWFHLRPRCARCDLRFEKEDGGFLGAMVVNYLVAFLVWTTVLVITMVFTVPDVPVGPLLAASVVVLVGNPIWFYPRSKALWAAIEYLVARSDPDYRPPVARDPRAKGLE
jgi:uncharacterized protein (DUF983 family)